MSLRQKSLFDNCESGSANAFQNDVLDFTAAHPFDYLKNLPLIV
jgi:hypothetical protein